jgi:hypothetical protein
MSATQRHAYQSATQQGPATDLLWYASYASNIHNDRFLCYLQGGTPPGATRANTPCIDPSPPRDSRILDIPHSLYFAGESLLWSGGIAFINPHADGATTKARAYLITWEQFCHIANQENWCHDEPVMLPSLADVLTNGYTFPAIGPHEKSYYARVVHCGTLDGYAVLTLAPKVRHSASAKPSLPYLRTIGAGIRGAYGMTPAQVALYLIDLEGVQGNYTYDELLPTITAGELAQDVVTNVDNSSKPHLY